jgi:hypothetical protein
MRNDWFIRGVHSRIHFISKEIYRDRDNIEGYMAHETILLESDLADKSALKWMHVVRDNIKDHIKKDYYVSSVHWRIELTLKWMYVACGNFKGYIRNE